MAARTLERPKQDISAQAAFQAKCREADERINAVLRDLGLAFQYEIRRQTGPEGWFKDVVLPRYVQAKGK